MRASSHLVLIASLCVSACAVDSTSNAPTSEASAPIVGGVLDTYRSYVVGVGDNTGAFCTGTLISRRTVLTAGHCYTPGSADGGMSRVFFGATVAGSTFVGVVKAVLHPSYSDNTLRSDLSILQLDADAPTQPAPLLRETMDNGPTYIGPNFTFVGYGNDGNFNYNVRRVVTFPIVKVGPANVGLDTNTGPIDGSQFYYRTPGKNTCDGDSGGPSFLPRGPVERLAGTTSFGDAQCTIDGVNARTDMPQITAFIQQYIDQFEGANNPCRSDGVCDESCNANGQLGDPDCAENHCLSDGICALSCVSPIDPDCGGANLCDANGLCDPTCAPADPDCGAAGAGGTAGSGGIAGSAGSSGSAGTSGNAGAGGAGGSVGGAAGATGGTAGTAGTSGASGTAGSTHGTSGSAGSSSGTAGSGGASGEGGNGANTPAPTSSDDSGCGCRTAASASGENTAAFTMMIAGAVFVCRARSRNRTKNS